MEEINSWDEFVPADRLRKMNEENLRLQKELNDNTKPSSKRTNPTPNAKAGMKMSSKAGSEDLPGASGTLPPRGQKRGRELEIEKVCCSESLCALPPEVFFSFCFFRGIAQTLADDEEEVC